MKTLLYSMLLLIYSSNLFSQTILREKVSTVSFGQAEKIIKGENDNFYILMGDFTGVKRIIDLDYATFDINWSNSFGFKASPTGDYDSSDISLLQGDIIVSDEGIRYSGGRIHHILLDGYYYYTHLINTDGEFISDTLVYEKDNWDLYIDAQNLDFIQKEDFSLAYGYQAGEPLDRTSSFVMKYDNKGKLLKRSNLDTIGELEYQSIWKMKEVADGEYVLIGNHRDTTKEYPGFFTARMNSELEFYQKERIFDDKSINWMVDFDVNTDQTAVLFQNKNYENKIEDTPEVNMLLAFLDKEGKLESFKIYVEEFYTIAKGIKAYQGGYLIYGLTGKTKDMSPFYPLDEKTVQNIVIFIDKDGKEIWRKVWGEDGVQDMVLLCERTNEDKIIVVSLRASNLVFTELNTIILSVSENENQDSQNHIHIYPNPSNNITTVELSSTNIQNITIYNSLGTKLRTFANPMTDIRLSKEEFGVGVFFVRINSGEETVTKKLIFQ